MKIFLKFLAIFSLVFIFLACSSEKKVANNKKELVITTAAIRSLDSVKATDQASFNVISNTQETLLVYDNNKPVFGAAKSFELSKDGLKYTFHLRDDLFWSDGKALSSKDFLYAWRRLLDPNSASNYSFFLFSVKNAKDFYNSKNAIKKEDIGLYAPDDKTFIVELSYKVPYFTQIAAFPALSPQRQDIVEKYGQGYATKPENMVYSGPYMVNKWNKGSKIELIKNPHFWDKDLAKLDKISLLELKELSTVYQMFKDNQLDIAEGGTGEYIKRYDEGFEKGAWDKINMIIPRQFYMTFNFNKKEFQNLKVRKAFSAALDRESFVNKVLKAGIPAYGFVPPGILVGDINYREAVSEPLRAQHISDPKALLIEGLKELGMDGDPSKHSFGLLQRKNDSQMKIEGEYLKNMWESALGVHIELLSAADFADFLDKDDKGQYDISYQGWAADYNSALTFLDYYSSWNGYNTGNYKNELVDNLIKSTQGESDDKKRLAAFKKIEQIYVVEDPATMPLYYKDVNVYLKSFVKGLQLSLFGGKYQLRWTYIEDKK